MHLEKFCVDQIQYGPLSAIIYFHMPNILQTVLDFSQRFAISDRLSSSYLTLRLGFLDLVVLRLNF